MTKIDRHFPNRHSIITKVTSQANRNNIFFTLNQLTYEKEIIKITSYVMINFGEKTDAFTFMLYNLFLMGNISRLLTFFLTLFIAA